MPPISRDAGQESIPIAVKARSAALGWLLQVEADVPLASGDVDDVGTNRARALQAETPVTHAGKADCLPVLHQPHPAVVLHGGIAPDRPAAGSLADPAVGDGRLRHEGRAASEALVRLSTTRSRAMSFFGFHLSS